MLLKDNSILEFVCSEAAKLHEGQFRKDGMTPYISHPIAVCDMMTSDGITDTKLLAVALLHDVIEDTKVTDEQLVDMLSAAFLEYDIIYRAVLDMTNIDKLYKSLSDAKINRATKKKLMNEHFARFASPYAIITKIYDRYHNLTDLHTMKADDDFKKKYLEESSNLINALESGLARCNFAGIILNENWIDANNMQHLIVRQRLDKLKAFINKLQSK